MTPDTSRHSTAQLYFLRLEKRENNEFVSFDSTKVNYSNIWSLIICKLLPRHQYIFTVFLEVVLLRNIQLILKVYTLRNLTKNLAVFRMRSFHILIYQRNVHLPETQRKCLPGTGSLISINSTSLCFPGRNKTLCISSLRRDDITDRQTKEQNQDQAWWGKIYPNKQKRNRREIKEWRLQCWSAMRHGSVGRGKGVIPSFHTHTQTHTHTHSHVKPSHSQALVWWSISVLGKCSAFIFSGEY